MPSPLRLPRLLVEKGIGLSDENIDESLKTLRARRYNTYTRNIWMKSTRLKYILSRLGTLNCSRKQSQSMTNYVNSQGRTFKNLEIGQSGSSRYSLTERADYPSSSVGSWKLHNKKAVLCDYVPHRATTYVCYILLPIQTVTSSVPSISSSGSSGFFGAGRVTLSPLQRIRGIHINLVNKQSVEKTREHSPHYT